MKSICVYCASSPGINPVYGEIAYKLGEYLAEKGIEVIYGGAAIGLMGKLADGALSKGGKVLGIIPEFLKTKEIAHHGLTELITVQTMHERKAMLVEKSDGFIALPGGFGTMDELFETLTWAQLKLHNKPIGVLNVNGYYDSITVLLDKMVEAGLLQAKFKEIALMSNDIENLITQMEAYEAPIIEKLIKKVL